MAIQTINIGTTPNDGTGDPARTCFSKINANFTDSANAASKLVATPAQALAGTAGVLPDAAGVHDIVWISIDVTTPTGSVQLDGSLPVGVRWVVRKLNSTQGTVTITCTGHTFTCDALASITLNSDGDYWLIEKVSAARLELVGGYESGQNSIGWWVWDYDGTVREEGRVVVNGTYTPGATEGANGLTGQPKTIPKITNYDSDAQFKVGADGSGNSLTAVKISFPTSANAGGIITHHGFFNKGDAAPNFNMGATTALSVIINKHWVGRWYKL